LPWALPITFSPALGGNFLNRIDGAGVYIDWTKALTDSFCRDHGAYAYRGLARAMTAALCRNRAESLTDVKGMGNRKPWRHKKVLLEAIRIWAEEELCYGASEACFKREASN
jgi:hypothetical protein